MEEVQPPSTPSLDSCSENGSTIQSRFKHFCKKGLSMDDITLEEAIKLFDHSQHLLVSSTSTLGSGVTPEEAELYWFAFVLFSVKRLNQRTSEDKATNLGTRKNEFTLCQILRVAKLNVVDFFKELPQYIVKASPILSDLYGADWRSRFEAKELQTNFVHLSLLSKYYKRAFREFFSITDENVKGRPVATNAGEYISNCHRFGWLLFLALRVHAFSRFKDLVTCTNGLVSILAILIIHVPVRFRNFSIKDSPHFVKKGNIGVDLCASLCNMYETSADELEKAMEKANNLISVILKKRPCLASGCQSENLDSIGTDGLIYFEDLLEESSLSSTLHVLEKDYDDAICSKCELDERLFINDEDSVLGSSSLSGGAVNISGTKRKIVSVASPTKTISSPLSPYHSPSSCHANERLDGVVTSKMVATPVSTAMTTAKWLRTIISPLPPEPSPELVRFFSSCDKDVTADVIRRARVILEAIFSGSGLSDQSATKSLRNTNLMDNVWAEERRSEALKLYYRVLQAMCTAEAQILHGINLTSLLTNERFHRCMLACSAELVLATHKTATMLFPAVLERTGITSFDLSKVIESFVRHEESLPRELRRHLNSLEERLLESMVWEKGSSMYNSLIVARPSLCTEISPYSLLAEPMPSLDAIEMQINMSSGGTDLLLKLESSSGHNEDIRSPKRVFTEHRSLLVERNSFKSPVKPVNNLKSKLLPPALQSAFASPTRPNPGGRGETCAETAINVFFGKIVKLAAVRISGMVERLQLSLQIRERVYCLFQQILTQRTALFFNRHIDQIILCCLYGVAKISQLALTFREIVYNYRKKPQCKPQVFRSVFIDWSSARHTEKTGKDHVDIITFYNEVFIPIVKPLLVELTPAGVNKKPYQVSESKDNGESQCHGSPKISQFPSLPDMSPMKLPGVHSVYVSQLKSPKMDASISHSSKSYYACFGESTHAYQSPSKDLTAINNQLKGDRKVRGTLNFDDVDIGLVSDSVVTKSLHLQNGTSPSLSSAPGEN